MLAGFVFEEVPKFVIAPQDVHGASHRKAAQAVEHGGAGGTRDAGGGGSSGPSDHGSPRAGEGNDLLGVAARSRGLV